MKIKFKFLDWKPDGINLHTMKALNFSGREIKDKEKPWKMFSGFIYI